MKFSLAFVGITVSILSVNAQYFSAGWKPGQPAYQPDETQTEVPAQPTFAPGSEESPKASAGSLSDLFDVSNLLSSPPVAAFFSRFGINMTERVETIKEQNKLWDDRLQLITDENYDELIVNEPLTEQQEKDRVWIIVITVSAGKQDGISRILDNIFDSAYNETLLAGDLPNVRWGRIDYLQVTAITTKWAVWQAPCLVVLTDRGRTLRFYKAHQLRLRDQALREFLQTEGWLMTPPWSSRYAPGGDREYIMDFLADWMAKFYNITVMVPRWLLFIISGSFASILINLLHKSSGKPPATAASASSQPSSQPQAVIAESSAQAPKRTAKQRKGGNK